MKRILLFVLCLSSLYADAPAVEQPLEESQSTLALGIDVGSPQGVNLRAGFFHPRFSLVAGGMYWSSENYGYEGAAAFNFFSSRNFYQGLGVVAGYFSNNPLNGLMSNFFSAPHTNGAYQYTYVGPEYSLYLSGFTLSLGVGFGSGDYASPQVIFHFGYLFRLI